MIRFPAILREIASFGGSLDEKGPLPIAVLHYSPLQGLPCPHGMLIELLVIISNIITYSTV